MPSIRVRGLVKRWGDTTAVDGIGFEIEDGSFAVLLGPSGCGKSTTLRLIAGLDRVSEGSIYIGEHDVTRVEPAKRGVAMVFQNYALFPHLSIEENIVFGLKVRRLPASERRRRLDKAVEILGLGDLLQRKPSQLSGGQQQRVALGRAIVAEAGVCLMDEPLSNLDAKLRSEMRREIRELQQRLSMTMVYVTHDQAEAMSMADQVILMNKGRIEQDGRPGEIYKDPATPFAASFIGTPPMNLIEREGSLVGIRPEVIELSETGQAATVQSLEYLGADTILSCRLDGQEVLVRRPGEIVLRPGTTVHLAWRAKDEQRYSKEHAAQGAA